MKHVNNMAEHVTDYKKFWIENKLRDIAGSDSWIQGDWDIEDYLYSMFDAFDCDDILDFGCGYGRLAQIFPPEVYLGVDLNPHAIDKAFQKNPDYAFKEVNIDSVYPRADMVLAFTVLLHMDDDTLRGVLRRLAVAAKKYIIVIETLGHEWRRSGTVPVYNRWDHEYIEMFDEVGFRIQCHDKRRNDHYADDPRFAGRNCNTDVLIFKKRD